MGLKLKFAACLPVVACLAAAAQAGPLVISVNFAAEQAGLNSTDVAGVIPAMNWNKSSGPNGTTALVAGDGTTTGGTVSWSGPTDDWNTAGGKSTPDQRMMYGYVDAGSGGPLTINFSGLPAAIGPIYDVYVYVAGDMGTSGAESRTGDYTIGKKTILATQGSSNSAYTLAGNGTAGNYIEFQGISGSSFSLVAAASATL